MEESAVTKDDPTSWGRKRSPGKRWVGSLGWANTDGEREAWGEDEKGATQECLKNLVTRAEGREQRWHVGMFEEPNTDRGKYEFSSSNVDDNKEDGQTLLGAP